MKLKFDMQKIKQLYFRSVNSGAEYTPFLFLVADEGLCLMSSSEDKVYIMGEETPSLEEVFGIDAEIFLKIPLKEIKEGLRDEDTFILDISPIIIKVDKGEKNG